MLKNHSLSPKKAEPKADILAGLDDDALLELRARIDLALKTDLARIKLGEELGLNYRQGKRMLEDALADADTPFNQKAQVFNSVSAMLERIVKQQQIVYSAERLKRYESAVLKVLGQLGDEPKRVFFDLYGEFLAADSEAAKAAAE